ncbi:MAG: DUF2490 domain-containing protein [Pacificimonas sp.]|jgi:hypothetical protein|nr:DUF2490 domain-containing protein [Pacificimonas sp.]
MRLCRLIAGSLATSTLLIAAALPAKATDEDFELWLNPSAVAALDEDTEIEFETAQRFRDSDRGRADTYFGRLWLAQGIADNMTLAGAAERRINDGGSNETRTMQQLSTRHGIIRTRLRLEQRFVDNADRMGLRLRPRLGVSVPVGGVEGLSFKADAELFWTLRGNNVGSDEGITGLRNQIGLGYDLSDSVSLSAVYLRQQDFEDNAPDEIGHAPLIGVTFAF